MQFGCYGNRVVVMSDSDPELTAEEYKHFSKMWKFQLITSSLHHPKRNGKAQFEKQSD